MNSESLGRPLRKSPNPPSERRWVLGFAAVVMLLTTLPYLLGYAFQREDWVFTGFVFGVEDGNSYIAKMLSGAAGAWVFRTPYTPSPQGGVIAFLPYLLLGKLASAPGLHVQLVALFHLFRFIAGILSILAAYDFLAYFVKGVPLRRFGLALAVLGGGLGWVLVTAGHATWLSSLPLDFYSPETFGFLGLYGIPHLALARAGLMWGLLVYLRSTQSQPANRLQPEVLAGLKKKVPRDGMRIGALWLLTALAQPLAALVFGGVIGLHLCATLAWVMVREWRIESRESSSGKGARRQAGLFLDRFFSGRLFQIWRQALRLALWSAVLPTPFLVYNALAFRLDPYLRAWTSQNLILSPHPLHYLLAYGLLLPFAYAGARRLLRRRPWDGWLPVAWSLSLPFLAYAPVNLQRRLPEGIWVALVVLAMVGVEGWQKRVGPRITLLPLVLAFPSTLLLLVGGVLAAARPTQPVFRPHQEIAAFEYLQSKARPFEVILSSYETGNALPAWAPVRVVIGHGPESAGLASLSPQVAAFYSEAATEAGRLDLLRKFDVHYIFWGPDERALGGWDPNRSGDLTSVFQSGPYQIFEYRTAP